MNMRLLLLLILAVFLLPGCKYLQKEKQEQITVQKFQTLVMAAMNGDKEMNDSLAGLFDLSVPLATNYNSLIIDSVTTEKRLKFYTLLIEYPNPFFNRFAIFDTSFHLLLLDKSLNGNLKQTVIGNNIITFLVISEKFKSKDAINLERVNLYFAKKDSAVKSLSTFLSYDDGTVQLKQSIDNIYGNIINTNYDFKPKKLLTFTKNSFQVDTITGKATSHVTVFDDKVEELIQAYKKKYSDKQIIDKKTALESVEKQAAVDSVHEYSNVQEKKAGFSLTLPPEGWRTQKDVYITRQVKKARKGIIYANDGQGATISVVELNDGETAEDCINYALDQEVKKFYTVRFTDKILIQRSYFRFFEVSCLSKKYLIIFEAPKLSYEAHLQEYQDIINSFGIDC